jgi:hypothetical protein
MCVYVLIILQGTQSSNPHNDYCQHFVDTGQRPQNFIRDVGLADRFEEYPKLRELIKLKVGFTDVSHSVVLILQDTEKTKRVYNNSGQANLLS